MMSTKLLEAWIRKKASSIFHEQPNPDCPVGRNIHRVLEPRLVDAQQAMEEKLRKTTFADIVEDTKHAVQNESD